MSFQWFCLSHLPFLLFIDLWNVLINTDHLYLASRAPSFVTAAP